MFAAAFGTPNSWAAGGGLHCGNGAHLIGGLYHASWSLVPDFQHCKYAIYFGASKGHGAGLVVPIAVGMAGIVGPVPRLALAVIGTFSLAGDFFAKYAIAKAGIYVPLMPAGRV